MATKGTRFFHSESEKDFLAWLGLYVTTWSGVEHALFSCLKTLSYITEQKIEHKPMALKSKLKLFRSAFNHPHTKNELEEAEAIITFLESESDFRHTIIHGVNARFRLPEGGWHNQQWMPERNEHPDDDNITVVDQAILQDHYHKIGRIIFALMALNHRILGKLEKLITEAKNKSREG